MSWVAYSQDCDFPIQNLPWGLFSVGSDARKRIGVAIGDMVLDLSKLQEAGITSDLPFDDKVLASETMNAFMALDRSCWRATRALASSLLSTGGDDRLSSNEELKGAALLPMSSCTMHVPAHIGDYTDFYSSREHATNVGTMFRGADNALQPNWLHLPVGYHGRSSSVCITGTDVVRPRGQTAIDKTDLKKGSAHTPCRLMDYELEMAFFVGGPTNKIGTCVSMAEAEDRIFGVVIMNDWSARDVQAFEYVPLGPFTAKNFMTTISPWIVSLDALEEFRCSTSAGEAQTDPVPLPYITDPNYATSTWNIPLTVAIKPEGDTEESVVTKSNLRYLYWNMKQHIVHHSVTGCPMRAGDLLGTGTISGPTQDSFGSMLELSWKGTREVELAGDKKRKFLQDGDEVIMRGGATSSEGYRIGFGVAAGKVLPAGAYD